MREYRGTRVALVGFWALTALTLVRSMIHIVAPDGGAESIATIPLNSFSPAAAAAVVHLFALWGLSQLLIGALYVVALARYRALIPLLYLLAVAEYLIRIILTFAKPLSTVETAPGVIGNYILLPLLLILFVLSLKPWGTTRPRSGAAADRYARHRHILGDEAWARLPGVKCVVAGAGGLGSNVITLLARLGPVDLHLWDPGVLDPPDLNRQILYQESDVGTQKVHGAAQRVRAMNSECLVAVHSESLTWDRFVQLYGDNPANLVLFDCVDNQASRAEFHRIATQTDVPVFHAAVEGWYGQVATFTGRGSGYDDVLPRGWREADEPGKQILPHIVTTAAATQVGEFVHWLRGDRVPLSTSLLQIDGVQARFSTFTRRGHTS